MTTPAEPSAAERPFLAACLPAANSQRASTGVGITIINFNTARQTLRCIESLRASTLAPEWVVVLDNASATDDYAKLLQQCTALPDSDLRIYRSPVNLGFAAGSNFLLDELLAEQAPPCQYFGLLNNDAVAMPDMVRLLVSALDQSAGQAGLAGGRMHRLAAPEEVDTLGIALYASLMPADRKATNDPYLGPTGGCCLAARDLLLRLKQASGYCFDERYFCYCEDTDLVLRSVLLGARPVYVDQLIALHEGQASSGGKHNHFITYHGLRNSIWMHAKLIPGALLVKYGALLVWAHFLSIVRHLLAGRWSLLRAIYGDALAKMPQILAERRVFAAQVRTSAREFDAWIAPRFYRQGYLLQVLRGILKK